jgi:hypothetical protein
LQAFFTVRLERQLIEQIGHGGWHLIDAWASIWASMKSFVPKDGSGKLAGGGGNGGPDFHREKRSNETHASTTDPDARLFRKGAGRESRLCLGLAVDADVSHATGTAERDTALAFIGRHNPRRRIALAADKLFDVEGFVKDLHPHIAIDGRVSKLGVVPQDLGGRTTRHPGYAESLRVRKRIEEIFGWAKTTGGIAKVKLRGLAKVKDRLHLRHRRLQSHPHPEPHRSGRMTTDADGQTLRHLSQSRRPPATAASPLTPKINTPPLLGSFSAAC